MEKGSYKYIVASDLDGTLLDKSDSVSPENERAIEEMTKRGVCFVPCSGRTFNEMPKAILDNPNIRYYIGADGAVIFDKLTGERTEFCMSREAVRPVLDLLEKYSTLSTVRYKGYSYADSETFNDADFERRRVSYLYGLFIKFYVKSTENFSETVRNFENIEMICTFFENDAEMAECKTLVEQMGEFSIASSEPTNIEIFHRSAGKGSALLALADMLGVPHERTVAVGDSKNDLDMIKKAGISLAMENASDELKAAAQKTICHYKNHSAKYILENILSL